MLELLANLGDTMVTMHMVQALDPKEEVQFTYELHFLDVPTGATHTIVCEGENDAVLMFAAWLSADEANPKFERYIDRLYDAMPEDKKRKFLP